MNEITFHPDVPQKVQDFVHKLNALQDALKEEMGQILEEFYPEPSAETQLAFLFITAHQEPGDHQARINVLCQGNINMIEAGLQRSFLQVQEGGEG